MTARYRWRVAPGQAPNFSSISRSTLRATLRVKETLSSSEAVEQARKQGMAEMSEKFCALGGEVYVEEDRS